MNPVNHPAAGEIRRTPFRDRGAALSVFQWWQPAPFDFTSHGCGTLLPVAKGILASPRHSCGVHSFLRVSQFEILASWKEVNNSELASCSDGMRTGGSSLFFLALPQLTQWNLTRSGMSSFSY